MTAAIGMRVVIPMVPDAVLNPNARVHWARRAKAIRELRRAAWAAAYDARGPLPISRLRSRSASAGRVGASGSMPTTRRPVSKRPWTV